VIDTYIYYDESGTFLENFRDLGGVDALLKRLVQETIQVGEGSKMEEDTQGKISQNFPILSLHFSCRFIDIFCSEDK
jgi:hypothetical protein